MAKKKTTTNESSKQKSLSDELVSELNKDKKDHKIAYYLDSDEAPTNVHGWVSTGSSTLDLAVSNRPYGGLPVGRIIELQGIEQAGKSLLTAHILANTQKQGGVAVLIDTETAVNRDFYEAIGIDISKLVYIQADIIEDIFQAIETLIEKVRKSDKDKMVTIVVDSVAGASTRDEINGEFDKEGYGTAKSQLMGRAMRKITNMIGRERVLLVFTNQLRQRLNAMVGQDKWIAPGGKALPHHASVQIRLVKIGKIKNKKGDIIGIRTKASVIKNRLGPPQRNAEFEIYFDRGVDDTESWLDVLKTASLVKQGGAWYTYVQESTGEELKFQSKDFTDMLQADDDLRDEIYRKMCESYILQYRSNGLTSSSEDLDVEVSTDD